MPFASTAIALASIAAAGTGVGEAVSNSGRATQGADTNNQIAQQELANKQQIFGQLQPFFSQYLDKGSPFLQNIQRAGAEQNAQQFGNAAGQVRSQMGTSGLGYGPSGTTAATLGQLGTQEAQSSANSYLQNLLQNEQVKFQAAQGMNSLGQMFSGQNTVGQTPQPVQTTTGSSVGALGTALQNLLKQTGGNTGTGNLPLGPGFGSGQQQPSTQTPPFMPAPTQGIPI